MAAPAFRPFVQAAALALVLAGCADEPRPAAPAPNKTFSAEDKRVAMMLSLGAAGLEVVDSDPRRQAALCQVLVGELRQRLADAGALTAPLQKAFADVGGIYARRAAAGGGASPSGQDLARDLTPEQRGSAAIGCVERLQSPG